MTEPTTAGVATVGIITFASLQNGINGDALIAAFAGAAVFAIHSVDIPVYKRLMYMIISIPLGYIFAPMLNDVLKDYINTDSLTVCSFISSAAIVTGTRVMLDGVANFKLNDILSFIKSSKKGGQK